MTVIQFKPAVRGSVRAIVGISGPSGGGKSLSALMIARGLADARDEDVFALDSENQRLLHYACAEGQPPDATHFRFMYHELEPPFSPENYQNGIEAAMKAKAKVILIDSLSHEHEYILEWHDRELTRMAGTDYEKRDRMKFAAWIEPKKAHRKLVSRMLQAKCYLVLTFRAKDAIKPIKNSKGKTEFLPVGWTPIATEGLQYEATVMLILPPRANGVPDLAAEWSKIQDQHAHIFPAGQALNEKTGRDLATWCRGSASPPNPKAGSQSRASGREPAASDTTKPIAASPPADHKTSSAGRSAPTETPGAAPGEPEAGAAPADRSSLAGSSGGPPASPAANVAGTGRAPADETSEARKDQREIYNGLYASLQTAAEPRAWWKDHTRSLQFLEEAAPDLHADLMKLAKTKQSKKAS